MARARKVLLVILLAVLLLGGVPAGWLVWRARRALPAYDGQTELAGLGQPVRVLRDERAVPHLYAANLDDLVFAQGYAHAQERLWQMDILRRTVRGELAEILGQRLLSVDQDSRRLGLGGVADRAVDTLDPDARRLLEAYARGVNAYIESHPGSPLFSGLPVEFALLHYRPEPWRPADSLALGLHMYRLLYTSWPSELARARVSERVGPERAADLFPTRSDLDHPIAQMVPAPRLPRRERVFVARRCPHSLEEILAGVAPANLEGAAGSNNWVAAGSRTASGAPLVADDMHLPHGVPSIWFLNHLKSPEVDVIGFSLPGIPLVVVGHNQRLAWGVTNLMVDTQDLFIEQFDPDDPSYYMTPTGWQKVGRRREHIRVRGGPTVDFEVLETRHGPVVHEDGNQKLALQWTARDPALLRFSLLALNQAGNWEEFTRALRDWGWAPQNFVYADAEGNIGYTGAGRIPRRRTGRGEVPVPGETTRYDWIEFIPFEGLPHAFNPPSGILATANNRIVPDGYPYHLTDRWISPSRIARIFALLEEDKKFAPADFLRIQSDVVSLPDRFLAGQLIAATGTVALHPPDRAAALQTLAGWDGAMRAEQAAPLVLEATRPRLMEELLRPHLADDWESYSWFMAPVFLENILRERPPRWLPAKYQSYDELLLAALDRGVEQLRRDTRAPDLRRLRWGDQQRVRFIHQLGERLPVLRRWFSVQGPAQSGSRYTVKQTYRTSGVSQRMVVDFSDLDSSLMNITLGESGHVASPHYQDQYRAWLEVRSFPAPFTDAGVERAARHTQHLLPR